MCEIGLGRIYNNFMPLVEHSGVLQIFKLEVYINKWVTGEQPLKF